MSEARIPEAVRQFVAEYVDSAELLETLLLVHGQPEREWTPDEVAQSIYTVSASATRRLEQLAALGLVRHGGEDQAAYRWAPATDELRERVDALAATYREQRVAVVNLIYAKPADPVRSFADAFKFRKG